MSTFCKPQFDGLGTGCLRCGCWARGTKPPRCPPFVTRCEPDGTRLPDIKSEAENRKARLSYFAELDAQYASENPAVSA